MFEYITGKLVELNPTHAVLDLSGIGFHINISLQTYSQLDGRDSASLFIHSHIREDAHTLFGFYSREERDLFRLLIGVSGIGANTARLILSSLSVPELIAAISEENVEQIRQVKGIGLKTAQRVVVDLKDKVSHSATRSKEIATTLGNTSRQEALTALVMLGFARSAADKVLGLIVKQEGNLPVEALIKHALKRL